MTEEKYELIKRCVPIAKALYPIFGIMAFLSLIIFLILLIKKGPKKSKRLFGILIPVFLVVEIASHDLYANLHNYTVEYEVLYKSGGVPISKIADDFEAKANSIVSSNINSKSIIEETNDSIIIDGKISDEYEKTIKSMFGDGTTIEEATEGIVYINSDIDYSDTESFINQASILSLSIALDKKVSMIFFSFGGGAITTNWTGSIDSINTMLAVSDDEPLKDELKKAYKENEIFSKFNLIDLD